MSISNKVIRRENLWWPGDDKDCWDYYALPENANVPEIITKLVPQKRVVVQAGGNTGIYVRQYAKLFDRVYTFEPDPINFLCLTLNCDSENVIKFQACVGKDRNLVSLDQSDNCGAIHVGVDENGIIPGIIPTMQIDDLNLDCCDLIQLDTEGFEYFALQGAIETLEKFKPILCLEWVWAKRFGIEFDKIESFLDNLNYKLILTHCGDRIYEPK